MPWFVSWEMFFFYLLILEYGSKNIKFITQLLDGVKSWNKKYYSQYYVQYCQYIYIHSLMLINANGW